VVEVHPYVPFSTQLVGGELANCQSGVTLKYAEASAVPDLAEFEQFIPVCPLKYYRQSLISRTQFPKDVLESLLPSQKRLLIH
jgi:hypothetical protein